MEELIYEKSYKEYKQELDRELAKTAEGFVRIGYLLKLARDTDVLVGSGYANVIEFAEAEYSIDKSQVSRFIAINDEFSEGGYGDHLKVAYQGFGYAKLALMLRLPSEINQILTSDYSKAEIQAIKDEVDEERKTSDLEVLMEQETKATAIMEDDLGKTIKQLGADDPKLYANIWEDIRRNPEWNISYLQSMMAPVGQKVYSVRIQGIGRKMLSVKDQENGGEVALIDLRSNEKKTYTWQDVMTAWDMITAGENEAGYKRVWEDLYDAEWPKEEVAPVQLSEKTRVAQKKESKVQKAQKEPMTPRMQEWKSTKEPGDIVMDTESSTVGELVRKTDSEKVWIFRTTEGEEYDLSESCMGSRMETTEDQKPEEQEGESTEESGQNGEEQLPAQTSIKTNFPEIMPETEKWKLYMAMIEIGAKELIRLAEQKMYAAAGQQINELEKYIREMENLENRLWSEQSE